MNCIQKMQGGKVMSDTGNETLKMAKNIATGPAGWAKGCMGCLTKSACICLLVIGGPITLTILACTGVI